VRPPPAKRFRPNIRQLVPAVSKVKIAPLNGLHNGKLPLPEAGGDRELRSQTEELESGRQFAKARSGTVEGKPGATVRMNDCSRRIAALDDEFAAMARNDPAARRLATIPGVGVLNATALVAAIGDGRTFSRGRDLSAWLGLVPRQASTGGLGKAVTPMGPFSRMAFRLALTQHSPKGRKTVRTAYCSVLGSP
jgi:hypothetical protein